MSHFTPAFHRIKFEMTAGLADTGISGLVHSWDTYMDWSYSDNTTLVRKSKKAVIVNIVDWGFLSSSFYLNIIIVLETFCMWWRYISESTSNPGRLLYQTFQFLIWLMPVTGQEHWQGLDLEIPQEADWDDHGRVGVGPEEEAHGEEAPGDPQCPGVPGCQDQGGVAAGGELRGSGD